MLFKQFDFEDSDIIKKFKIGENHQKHSWEQYYECYNYSFSGIIEKGLQYNYAFNCRARPMLFLLRHILELNLKYNLAKQKKQIPNFHSFDILADAFGPNVRLPENIINVIEFFSNYGDGECFRYFINKTTQTPYFDNSLKIEVSEIIRQFNQTASNELFSIKPLCSSFNYESNSIKWAFTFHMGECKSDWNIKEEYDRTIEFLIEGVLFNSFTIEKIYLPLLFLIRHALELALKLNIKEIQKFSDLINQKDFKHEHSLSKLYKCYKTYLETLEISKLDVDVLSQYNTDKKEYDALNNMLNQLDRNSRYLRYPVDTDGNCHQLNMSSASLISILKLYQKTDPFINFTNRVMNDAGILI